MKGTSSQCGKWRGQESNLRLQPFTRLRSWPLHPRQQQLMHRLDGEGGKSLCSRVVFSSSVDSVPQYPLSPQPWQIQEQTQLKGLWLLIVTRESTPTA